ncbi:MAG TPA: M1 family aminopeptidase, partial [Chitinophagaceae bacterium]
IAHQWFGNTATEKTFTHLWLSEGFATYLTNIYLEQKYGKEKLAARLQEQREEVILFTRRSNNAVVDSTTPFMQLLNANSYQKGGWVLHMLRGQVGDSTFRKILQTYYGQYKGRNADTRDFQQVAETVSGKDLKGFFDQWLYRPGVPQLAVSYFTNHNSVTITIEQKQKQAYTLPLEVRMVDAKGNAFLKKVPISEKKSVFSFTLAHKIEEVSFDPDTNLLFEKSVFEAPHIVPGSN